MKFYSGKTEQVKEKYERMRNEFEEVKNLHFFDSFR